MAIELPLDQIICGDNCDVLGTFPRDCIDLVVTSPPYDDLRTYGGHEWDFYGVAWQLKRVLKPGGVIVWIVSDATISGSETGTSFKHAMHIKDLGLNLHDTMIYQKMGSSPNTHHPRYTSCFEYMFVFSSGTPMSFTAVRKRRNSKAGVVRKPTTKTQRNGQKKSFNVDTKTTPKESSCGNIWEYAVGAAARDEGTGVHPAYFPEALARDHILSWSDEGSIVLDPFNGSGTTTKMARECGRRYIGIDVNDEYCEIARKRLAQQLLW